MIIYYNHNNNGNNNNSFAAVFSDLTDRDDGAHAPGSEVICCCSLVKI